MEKRLACLGGLVGKLRLPGAELAVKKFSSTQNRITKRLSLIKEWETEIKNRSFWF